MIAYPGFLRVKVRPTLAHSQKAKLSNEVGLMSEHDTNITPDLLLPEHKSINDRLKA